MKFFLFSKISFEIPEPIALIECYCYQNDFYSKYDLLLEDRDRKIEDGRKQRDGSLFGNTLVNK